MSCRRLIALGILLLAISAGGCQREYAFVPVEGTITRDGQPLAGVRILFIADPDSKTRGPRSWGMTDATGHYRLRTDRGDDGAVVGQHRICIVTFSAESLLARLDLEEDGSGTTDEGTPRKIAGATKVEVPKIYEQIHTTPLRAEVRFGGNQTMDFDIPP